MLHCHHSCRISYLDIKAIHVCINDVLEYAIVFIFITLVNFSLQLNVTNNSIMIPPHKNIDSLKNYVQLPSQISTNLMSETRQNYRYY